MRKPAGSTQRGTYGMSVMIPVLPSVSVAPAVAEYLAAVTAAGFTGDLETSEAARLAVATDNSIYQVLPAAVALPRTAADVALLLRIAQTHPTIVLTARGGGTSTNGQCLTHGIVIDHSRYQTRILALDPAARTARVEPGVVLDTLNQALAAHGLHVGPTLSTSSRATIGGMVGTDAAGKGSRRYGKTSEHIVELEVVLADGTPWVSRALTPAELTWICDRDDAVGRLHRELVALIDGTREQVAARFPRLDRFLAGYNLARVRQADGRFNLSWLIAGAEGTLAVVTAITLRLIPIPAAKLLVVRRYPTFAAALADARDLLARDPQAIETIDATVVGLARASRLWSSVGHLLPPGDGPLNLIQFTGDSAADVAAAAADLAGVQLTDPAAIAACWDLRKAGVGLLGNLPGRRKPVPFIEDTVVPPEHLAAYAAELAGLLDQHGLRYGMFGHVDVGCLHVRPALDLTDPADAALIRPLTEAVVALTQKYGGLLWGEHGKGYRGEFLPTYLGTELHAAFREVKTLFDPANRLNPGKLVTPCGCDHHPLRIDEVPLRGDADRTIPLATRDRWTSAVGCNGNAACQAPDPHAVMCPTAKTGSDRRETPRGRAGLVREWLRKLASAGHDADALPAGPGWQDPTSTPDDFSHQVHDALAGCLSCKACSGGCPVQVDVPGLKARFLAQYHGRYRRPLRDYALAALETVAPLALRLPRLANYLPTPGGLTGLPRFSVPAFTARRPPGLAPLADCDVILVPDVFTAAFDAAVLEAAVTLLAVLGWRVHVAPLHASGKPLHILGMLPAWRRTARAWKDQLDHLASFGRPLLALEPAVALSERDELVQAFGAAPQRLHLLGEWLAQRLSKNRVPRALPPAPRRTFHLLAHCTEQATAPAAAAAWRTVFARCGHTLTVVRTGCCGMAGAWGHQVEHQEASRAIFARSWAIRLEEATAAGAEALADGFSCRHQVARLTGRRVRHPVEVLAEQGSTSESH